MAKRGPKLRGPVDEAQWKMFDQLCHIQCTLNEIAAFFGCSTDTIERRVEQEHRRKFADYWNEKAQGGHISLRRKQYQMAVENGNISMLIWLGKQYLGQSDKREEKLDATVNANTTTTAKIMTMTPAERLELLKAARGEFDKSE